MSACKDVEVDLWRVVDAEHPLGGRWVPGSLTKHITFPAGDIDSGCSQLCFSFSITTTAEDFSKVACKWKVSDCLLVGELVVLGELDNFVGGKNIAGLGLEDKCISRATSRCVDLCIPSES